MGEFRPRGPARLPALAAFSAAFIVMSTLMLSVVWSIGEDVGRMSAGVRRVSLLAIGAAIALDESRRLHRRERFAFGLARQAPQGWRYNEPLAPVFWGLDTGMVVTTFRSTCFTWAAIAYLLLEDSPPVAATGYGLGFCLPLAVVSLLPDHGAPFQRGRRHAATLKAMRMVSIPLVLVATAAPVTRGWQ